MEILGIGFCLLAGLLYVAVVWGLPILIAVLLVRWILRSFGWEKPLAEQREEKAGTNPWPESAAIKEDAAAARAELIADRRKRTMAAALKEQGRLDRLALVYYVESALKSGMAVEVISAALKEKGWAESDITAAFSSYKELMEISPAKSAA